MANTFFAAQGRDMADSLVETEALKIASAVLNEAGDRLILPQDQRIAAAFSDDAAQRVLPASSDVPAGWQSLDIGPDTIEYFAQEIEGAMTVVWNGPMGVFEMPNFACRHDRGGASARRGDSARGNHNHRRRRFGGGGGASWTGVRGCLISLPVGEPALNCWKAKCCPALKRSRRDSKRQKSSSGHVRRLLARIA